MWQIEEEATNTDLQKKIGGEGHRVNKLQIEPFDAKFDAEGGAVKTSLCDAWK